MADRGGGWRRVSRPRGGPHPVGVAMGGTARGPAPVTLCRKWARRRPPVPVRVRHGVPGPGRPLLLARLPAPG